MKASWKRHEQWPETLIPFFLQLGNVLKVCFSQTLWIASPCIG